MVGTPTIFTGTTVTNEEVAQTLASGPGRCFLPFWVVLLKRIEVTVARDTRARHECLEPSPDDLPIRPHLTALFGIIGCVV